MKPISHFIIGNIYVIIAVILITASVLSHEDTLWIWGLTTGIMILLLWIWDHSHVYVYLSRMEEFARSSSAILLDEEM